MENLKACDLFKLTKLWEWNMKNYENVNITLNITFFIWEEFNFIAQNKNVNLLIANISFIMMTAIAKIIE